MSTTELEQTQTQTKANILPFYMVVDVSFSMSLEGKIDSANGIIDELTVALAEQPVVADKVRFGVIDFSDDAQVALPLCDLSMTPAPPPFATRGGTSYVAAFQRLREQIEKDVAQLKADGFAVHRPAVFFISDGEPTDEESAWRQAFAELTSYDKETKTGFAYFPNVIPFGIGARPDTLRDLIHPQQRSRAYFMKDGANAGKALAEMAEILIASTMLSGASFGNGGPGFVLPDESDMGGNVEAADYEDLL
jgi:uncharacterized protein YegL